MVAEEQGLMMSRGLLRRSWGLREELVVVAEEPGIVAEEQGLLMSLWVVAEETRMVSEEPGLLICRGLLQMSRGCK